MSWTKDSVAQKLSEILEINKESILKKMERTDSQYEVLKLRVEEDVANQIRTYINDEGVVGVYMATDAKRYYPYGALASQIIGFVGTDNYGLYGLEARCNSVLDGQTGLKICIIARIPFVLVDNFFLYMLPTFVCSLILGFLL